MADDVSATTPDACDPNASEREYWNAAPGAAWVTLEEELDQTLEPVIGAVIDRAKPQPGDRVLDIGCGTGALSLEVAAHVKPGGAVVGVDISDVLLGRARARAGGAPGISFETADAQVHPFAASFDLAVSRFGVMFFDDPVAAFANIAAALRPGGRVVFAAWAPIEENLWFSVPRDVAIALLGRPEPADPHAPGPFAFADASRVTDLMTAGGLPGARVEVISLGLAPPGGLDGAAGLTVKLGPAVRILSAFGGGAEEAACIVAGVRAAFAPYDHGSYLAIPASINLFAAEKPV